MLLRSCPPGRTANGSWLALGVRVSFVSLEAWADAATERMLPVIDAVEPETNARLLNFRVKRSEGDFCIGI